MRDQKNIWEDRFNDPSLDDQTWLEPAIDVFDNISNEIYVTSKKRYSYLLLLFLFVALTVSVALLIIPSTDSASGNSGENNSEVKTSQLSMLPSFNSKTTIPKDDVNSELQVANIVMPSNSLNENLDEKQVKFGENNIDNNLTIISNDKKSVKLITEKEIKSSLKEASNYKSIHTNKILPNLNLNSKSNKTTTIATANATEKNTINKIQLSVVGEEKSKATVSTVLSIPTLVPASLESLNMPDDIKLENTTFITPQAKNISKTFVSIGSNFESWNFSLNNNYATALNPADFSHSSGKGASLNVNLGTQLYKKLDLVGGVSIQKIQFTSGHNSALNYQLNQEQDGDASNMFNLTMASPIGFLESDLIVQRGSAATSIATDLVVDLHNEHNITNLDVNIGLDYTLIESNKLSFILGFRTGINKFLNINNALASFDLDNNSFSSGATDIVKGQSNVNTLTSYIGSSIKVEYNVVNNLSIGTNIGLTTNLAPIYQENDFSTQLSRIQSGVYLRFGF